jgi:hypothetical protein
MKRVICLLVLALTVPAVALAGDPTADQMMQRMMNCVICKPYAEHPEMHPSMRVNTLDTENGFMWVMAVADEKHVGTLHQCHEQCSANIEANKNMKPADYATKLCPMCEGMFKLMARGDVKLEEFKTHMGEITLATSATKEGVKALHDFAAESRKMHEMMMKMGTKHGEAGE